MTCPATEAPPTRTDAAAKNHRVGGEGAADQRHRAQAEEPGDEPTARVEVAQGDDEQQAGGVADLGGRDDGRGRPGPAVEGAGDLVQDGLRVVEVGHHGAGGHGDEDDERTRESRSHRAAPVFAAATGSGYRRPPQGQMVPPRRLSAVTPVSAVRISGTPMKASQVPKTSASTVMKAPMPSTKGQMEEPGNESIGPGAVGHLGVLAVGGAVTRRVDLAPVEVLVAVEAPVPEEVVEAGQEAEQRGAEQHDAAAVVVAPEPVDEADDAEEGPEEEQEERLDLHTPARSIAFPLLFPFVPLPLVCASRPCGTVSASGWL